MATNTPPSNGDASTVEVPAAAAAAAAPASERPPNCWIYYGPHAYVLNWESDLFLEGEYDATEQGARLRRVSDRLETEDAIAELEELREAFVEILGVLRALEGDERADFDSEDFKLVEKEDRL